MKPERIQFRADEVPRWELEVSTAAERKAAKQDHDEDVPKYKAIRRGLLFSCFNESMGFAKRVGLIAVRMDVEPSIYVHREYVNVRVPGNGKGLSEADFDFAESVDCLVD